MSSSIQIDSDAVRSLVSKAIIDSIGHDVVKEYLQADEVRQQVRQQIVDQVEKLLADNNWLYSSIGFAVGDRVRQIIEDGETR